MSDMNPRIKIGLPSRKDPAERPVFFDRVRIGTIRERYTPNLTFDAWKNGLLIYSPAETMERAAQALADYSTTGERTQ